MTSGGSGPCTKCSEDVGDLDLTYEAMELVTDTGLTFVVYGAEPGSPTAERLQLLANLSASTTATEPATGTAPTGTSSTREDA